MVTGRVRTRLRNHWSVRSSAPRRRGSWGTLRSGTALWSPDQQPPHHLGACEQCRFSGPWPRSTPSHPPNQDLHFDKIPKIFVCRFGLENHQSRGLCCVFPTINTQADDPELTMVCFARSGVLWNLLPPPHTFHFPGQQRVVCRQTPSIRGLFIYFRSLSLGPPPPGTHMALGSHSAEHVDVSSREGMAAWASGGARFSLS